MNQLLTHIEQTVKLILLNYISAHSKPYSVNQLMPSYLSQDFSGMSHILNKRQSLTFTKGLLSVTSVLATGHQPNIEHN